MTTLVNRLSSWPLKHRAALLITLLFATAFFIWQASQLQVNATPYFLAQSHPARVADTKLRNTFSNTGETLIITTVTEKEDIFNQESLSELYKLTLALEKLTLTTEADVASLRSLPQSSSTDRLVDSILKNGFSPSDSNIAQQLIAELSKQSLLTPEAKIYLEDLIFRLRPVKEIRNVVRVESVTSKHGELDIRQMMYNPPKNQQELDDLREEALNNPLLKGVVFSDDPQAINCFVELTILQDDAPNMRRLYTAVLNLIETMQLKGSYHLGGPPAIFSQTSAVLKQDSAKFFPAVFLVVMILLYLIFRDIRSTLLPMLVAILSVIWTTGTMALFGFQQNLVTNIIPVFLVSIGVADSIHYLTEYRRQRQHVPHLDAIKSTLIHLWKPMLMTTVTTAMGFLSLAYTEIAFIKELGFLVALGVVYAYILTITLLPTVLGLLKNKQDKTEATNQGFSERSIKKLVSLNASLVSSHYKLVLIGAVFLLLPIGFAMSKLQVNNEMIGYFDKESRLYQDNTVIEKYFAGAVMVEFMLTAKEPDYFKTPESLRTLEKLEAKLLSHPNVNAVYGLPDYLRLINREITDRSDESYRIPYENPDLIPQYYFLYESSNGDDIFSVIDGPYQRSRLIAFVDSDLASDMNDIITGFLSYVESDTDGELTVAASGFGNIVVNTRNEVISTQLISLAISVVGICLLLCFLFKSLAVGVLGTIPLVFTVLINFSWISLLGLYLDVGTSIVAPIAIGVGVDYAIYFLNSVKRNQNQYNHIDETIRASLKELYRPIGFNTIVLGVGFLVLTASSHKSIAHLGILISSTMFFSAIITLILLPSIIKVFNLFSPELEKAKSDDINMPIANSNL